MALSVNGAISLLVRTPTALFPIALGLAGLGSAMSVASDTFSLSILGTLSFGLIVLAAIVLSIDIGLYLTKFVRSRQAVREDFSVATRANLLAPGFMAAMILGSTWHNDNSIGGIIWMVASIGHLILLFRFVGRWLVRAFSPDDLNPTWFLPAAGIMTAALTWPHFGPSEWPLLLLAIGAILWIMLLPLIFRRLVFEPPLGPGLRPTLFILAAPFGLFAGGLQTLAPEISTLIPFGLLSGGGFLLLVLFSQPGFLIRTGIVLSWWAATFPVSVIAIGFLRLDMTNGNITLWIGAAFLLMAVATTSIATVATLRAAWCTCASTVSKTEIQIGEMQGTGR